MAHTHATAHEDYAARAHPETVVLDIGEDYGALIIHSEASMHGKGDRDQPRRGGLESKPQGGVGAPDRGEARVHGGLRSDPGRELHAVGR